MSREYERTRADEEAELCAVVNDYLSTRHDDVLCPVCTRANLVKPAHNVIACACCGLRLNLECDVISMTEIKARLQRTVECHASFTPGFGDEDSGAGKCGAAVNFIVRTEQTTHCQNLVAFCPHCDYFEIVLWSVGE